MKRSLLATEIAKPYAEALLSLARDRNLTEQISQDVNFLLNLLQESQELNQFLANPVIKAKAKKAVLQQIVKSQVHPYIVNFLMLLVDAGLPGCERSVSSIKACCGSSSELRWLKSLQQ